jgi:DNA polymerase III subunit delta
MMFDVVAKITENLEKGKVAPIYLILGDDEYLIRKLKNKLISILLPGDKKEFNLEVISEEESDIENKIIQGFGTVSLFRERKVITATLLSKGGGAIGKFSKLEEFLNRELDRKALNILILSGNEKLDKRGKLFKKITEIGEVIEFPPVKDSKKWTPEIEKEIFEMVSGEISNVGKTIKSDAYKTLLERTGYDFRSVFCELDKVCLFLGDRKQITKKDIEELVEETPQMAFYALGDAIGRRNIEDILKTLHNFLDSAKSPIYILQLMFDCLRNLKNMKEIQRLPDAKGYKPGVDFRSFSLNYLTPILEKKKNGTIKNPALLEILNWKPYRIYSLFQQSDRFDETELDKLLTQIKEIDLKMKSTAISSEDMLYNLAFSIVKS